VRRTTIVAAVATVAALGVGAAAIARSGGSGANVSGAGTSPTTAALAPATTTEATPAGPGSTTTAAAPAAKPAAPSEPVPGSITDPVYGTSLRPPDFGWYAGRSRRCTYARPPTGYEIHVRVGGYVCRIGAYHGDGTLDPLSAAAVTVTAVMVRQRVDRHDGVDLECLAAGERYYWVVMHPDGQFELGKRFADGTPPREVRLRRGVSPGTNLRRPTRLRMECIRDRRGRATVTISVHGHRVLRYRDRHGLPPGDLRVGVEGDTPVTASFTDILIEGPRPTS
jgi:hypothetical protein